MIPLKEAEEYSISMAEKTQEDISSQEELKSRHHIRKEFWIQLLKEMNSRSNLFQNISPSHYHWIGAGSGIGGVAFNFGISKSFARCEVYIVRGDQEENKFIFDFLLQYKDEIEMEFGGTLEWERLETKRASRIKYEDKQYNVFDKECWNEMVTFMADGMSRLEKALKDHLKKVNQKLKSREVSVP